MDPTPPDPDRYLALRDGSPVELKVKGSVFRGQALRAADEDDVARHLDAIRRAAHDATHHCWASRLGAPDELRERSDDDGEPSGTAGGPILAPLRRSSLHRALVVVVRWYGGTKLGTGGLARAYGEAALRAIEAAPRLVIHRERVIHIEAGYDDLGAIEAVLAREATVIRGVQREFEAGARLMVRAFASRAPDLLAKLREATAARADLELGEERDGPLDRGS